MGKFYSFLAIAACASIYISISYIIKHFAWPLKPHSRMVLNAISVYVYYDCVYIYRRLICNSVLGRDLHITSVSGKYFKMVDLALWV